jgi:hypothetical protein
VPLAPAAVTSPPPPPQPLAPPPPALACHARPPPHPYNFGPHYAAPVFSHHFAQPLVAPYPIPYPTPYPTPYPLPYYNAAPPVQPVYMSNVYHAPPIHTTPHYVPAPPYHEPQP